MSLTPLNVVLSGSLEDIAVKDSTLYLGGTFSRAGINAQNVVSYTPGNGNLAKFEDQPDADVLQTLPDGVGGTYMAGYFRNVGGEPRSRIAHVDANGRVTNRFKNMGFTNLRKIEKKGDTLFMGGSFDRVYDNKMYGIAYHKDSASVQKSIAYPNSTIYSVISDGKGGWFLAGNFTRIGTTEVGRLAHIDSTETFCQECLLWINPCKRLPWMIQFSTLEVISIP